jgi:hypothetical protein
MDKKSKMITSELAYEHFLKEALGPAAEGENTSLH